MKYKRFYYLLLASLVVVVLSFSVTLSYLKVSIDRVVLEDVKTIRDVLAGALQSAIKTQKEQEFFVVKNLLKAEELLSTYPDFSTSNLAKLVDFTGISGILVMDERGVIQILYPKDLSSDSILEGFSQDNLKGGEPYPYENDYAVNLASRISGKVVIFSVVKEELLEKKLSGGMGELLSSLERDKKISYVVLQDTEGVWFGIKVPENLKDVDEDLDLKRVFLKKKVHFRVMEVGGRDILEVALPFSVGDFFDGVLRFGVERSYYAGLYRGFVRNLLILHIFLFALIVAVLFFIYSRRGLNLRLATFETLSDHAKLGIALFDRDDRIVYWNEEFKRLMKISSESVKGLKLGDVMSHYPVLEVVSKKDSLKKVRITAVPILTKGKREATLLMVESTELEEKLERAQRLELLGEVASQLAHEIKNPLNSISMVVQRIASEFRVEPEMESRELISIVLKEVERIKSSINRFVSIMAPLYLKWECVKICEIVEEVLAEFLTEFRVKDIDFRTCYRVCPDIMADRERLKEALRNIIRNAIEAQNKGGMIKLAVTLLEDRIGIIVGDRGKGMSKEELEKFGTPFFTTKASGSGMGTFLVRKVVEAHGGELLVKSGKGKGTVIAIYLPYGKDRRC